VAGLVNLGNTCFFSTGLQVRGSVDQRARNALQVSVGAHTSRALGSQQVLASSPLVLDHLEECGEHAAAAAATAAAAAKAAAPRAPGRCAAQHEQLHAGWTGTVAAAARAALAAVLGAPSDADRGPATTAGLALRLRDCLRRLQPVAWPSAPLTAPAPVDPSAVRAALARHLPPGGLALGEQHDSAEALEVGLGRRGVLRGEGGHSSGGCVVVGWPDRSTHEQGLGARAPRLFGRGPDRPAQALCDALALERAGLERLRASLRRPPGLAALLGGAGAGGPPARAPGDGSEAPTGGRRAAGEPPADVRRGGAPCAARGLPAFPLLGYVMDEITCLGCSSR
jgi:hypothetical protein